MVSPYRNTGNKRINMLSVQAHSTFPLLAKRLNPFVPNAPFLLLVLNIIMLLLYLNFPLSCHLTYIVRNIKHCAPR